MGGPLCPSPLYHLPYQYYEYPCCLLQAVLLYEYSVCCTLGYLVLYYPGLSLWVLSSCSDLIGGRLRRLGLVMLREADELVKKKCTSSGSFSLVTSHNHSQAAGQQVYILRRLRVQRLGARGGDKESWKTSEAFLLQPCSWSRERGRTKSVNTKT